MFHSVPLQPNSLAFVLVHGPEFLIWGITFFSIESWWKTNLMCRPPIFYIAITVSGAFLNSGEFNCIAVTVLITAEYSRNLIYVMIAVGMVEGAFDAAFRGTPELKKWCHEMTSKEVVVMFGPSLVKSWAG